MSTPTRLLSISSRLPFFLPLLLLLLFLFTSINASSSSSSSSSSLTNNFINSLKKSSKLSFSLPLPKKSSLRGDAITAKNSNKVLNVLYLSSDTGGGHRSSAEALSSAFQRILDERNTATPLSPPVLSTTLRKPSFFTSLNATIYDPYRTHATSLPFNNIVEIYTFLSTYPILWGIFYHMTNAPLFGSIYMYLGPRFSLKDRYRDSNDGVLNRFVECVKELEPDVVVSVHPGMNYIGQQAVRIINAEREKEGAKKNIDIFTVITDLNTCHKSWFETISEQYPRRVYVCSDNIYRKCSNFITGAVSLPLPIRSLRFIRGKRMLSLDNDNDNDSETPLSPSSVSNTRIKQTTLPIRQIFTSLTTSLAQDKALHQITHKTSLNLPPNAPAVLIVAGGVGVGIEKVFDNVVEGLDGMVGEVSVVVVCGRNEILYQKLLRLKAGESLSGTTNRFTTFLKRFKPLALSNTAKNETNITIHPLRYSSNLPTYMSLSSCIVTKAGPGTVTEGLTLGVPLVITGEMYGQESGNGALVEVSQGGIDCSKGRKVGMVVRKFVDDEISGNGSGVKRRKVEMGGGEVIARDILGMVEGSL